MIKNNFFTLWVSLLLLCLVSSTKINAQCNSAAHSTNEKDSWLSCQTSMNPNSIRGNSHWLQYDLGYIYELGATTFWNYNVANFTNKGFKQVAIDYSLDGVSWVEAGTFQLPEATGTATYEGTIGLDLTGVAARYVIVTALSTWNNDNCAGLSEIRFEVHQLTANCGDYIITDNIEDDPVNSGTYYSDNTMRVSGVVEHNSNVTLQSATAISLEAGFIAEAGSEFLAKIESCNAVDEQEMPIQAREAVRPSSFNKQQTIVKVYPNPTINLLNIDVDGVDLTDLTIITVSGHEILRRSAGQNLNQIDVSSLPAGIYLVNLLTVDRQVISKRFIKGE